MSDALTVSFCERCGSRHEFRAPRGMTPLRKTRGFIGGLKNYLVSDDGLSDAMRDAMQAQESAVTVAQLEAFHAAVHLCLDCRQYTCNDCWNADAGRCRSCAPVAGVDDLGDRIAASLGSGPTAAAGPGAVPVFEHGVAEPLPAASWPEADHEVYGGATPADGMSGDVVVAEPETLTDATDLAEPDAADEPEPRTEAEAAGAAEPESEPTFALVVTEEREPETTRQEREQSVADGTEPEPVVADAREPALVADDREPEPSLVAVDDRADDVETLDGTRPADEPAAQVTLRVVAWDGDAPVATIPEPADELVAPDEAAALELEPEPVEITAPYDEPPDGAATDEAIVETSVTADDEAMPLAAVEEGFEPVAAAADLGAMQGPEDAPLVAAAERAAIAEVELDAPIAAEDVDEPETADLTSRPEGESSAPASKVPPGPAAAPRAPAADRGPIAPRRSGPMRDKIVRLPRRPVPPAIEPPRIAVAAEAESEEVAARRAQLEELGLSGSDDEHAAAEPPRVLPYRSRGAAAVGREPAPTVETMLWEASAREIGAAGVTVQSCTGCGLSLSASARFCRRCGTRQAQPA